MSIFIEVTQTTCDANSHLCLACTSTSTNKKGLCGDILPNNRHSVGLNLSLQLYITALDATISWLLIFRHLGSGFVFVSFETRGWPTQPVNTDCIRPWPVPQAAKAMSSSYKFVPLPRFSQVLNGPGSCQPFHRHCTFMSVRLLSWQTWLKWIQKLSRWVKVEWPADAQIMWLHKMSFLKKPSLKLSWY